MNLNISRIRMPKRLVPWIVALMVVAVVATVTAKDAGAIGYVPTVDSNGNWTCIPGFQACLY